VLLCVVVCSSAGLKGPDSYAPESWLMRLFKRRASSLVERVGMGAKLAMASTMVSCAMVKENVEFEA